MSKKIKKLVFIIVGGVVIVVSGIFIIRASNERGDAPYIYMKFNEGYGATVYDEQNNLNGAVTNATWKGEDECLSGKCLYFDGAGDYVSIPDFDLE